MSTKQNQDKLDKRAAALRENLRKRKPVQKKPAKDSGAGGKKDDRKE